MLLRVAWVAAWSISGDENPEKIIKRQQFSQVHQILRSVFFVYSRSTPWFHRYLQQTVPTKTLGSITMTDSRCADLGCRWGSWARVRGRRWGCWDWGSAAGSWMSLSCWARRWGRQRWWGSVVPRPPGNLRRREKKMDGIKVKTRRWMDQRWSCQGPRPFFKLITCYTKALRK